MSLDLAGLGELALRQRSYPRAIAFLEESLALRRQQGDRWGIGTSLGSLGWAAMLQGDYKRMRAVLGESIAVRIDIGDRSGIAWCLEKLAEGDLNEARTFSTHAARERMQRAARLFGAAAAIRAPLGAAIDSADQPEYERNLENLHKNLGKPAFSSAWEEGRTSIEQGLQTAIAGLLEEPDATSEEPSIAQEKPGGLTQREREVARLIVLGRSNRDIAQDLTVEPKTVETHITHIFNKLGFDSRVQIAVWAVEKGLGSPQ
jgi:non-specific serine/threonine protein kinase